MKNNNAAVPGSLPIGLIKHSPIIRIEKLQDIFNEGLKEAEVPDEWKLAHISALHKKGSKMNCKNYRGISVTSSVGRLYWRIFKMRIEEQTQEAE